MELRLSVKNQSIDSSGIPSDYKDAIAEYIWNGFEAHATSVDVRYSINEAYGVRKLYVLDNGDGIAFENIADTFGSFLISSKNNASLKAKSRCNKGKGRFSYAAFAGDAKWKTVYAKNSLFWEYEITSKNDAKEIIEYTEIKESEKTVTGTCVEFNNVFGLNAENMSFDLLEKAFLRDFAWFLYLGKNRDIQLKINGNPIDFQKFIDTSFSETVEIVIKGYTFTISLIVWKETIKEKFCCYFFDLCDVLKKKDTTSYNRNTIGFTHSVYVKSSFFNDVNECSELEGNQSSLFTTDEQKKAFSELKSYITKFIEEKMNLYMTQKANEAVRQMIEERNTFPSFPDDFYGNMKKKDLIKVTTELYKMEPGIFYKLRPIQEKSLLAFLNLLLSSAERENILSIIEQIVVLTPQQRDDFACMLKKTKLENIIDSIKFVQDRYKVIELLRTIIYDMTKFTNERDHIQKIVEQHFWLFGEQYNLASADVRMKNALQQYSNILYGEDDINVELKEDAEQERRMDIFLCSTRTVETSYQTTLDENTVIELKAPKVPLSKKVLRQIEDYMDFIKKQPDFNSELRLWKFIAVCKEIDDDVKTRLDSWKEKGKVGLVSQTSNYEVYAFTWDDVFKSFELVHNPLLKRLNYDREQLAQELLKEVQGNDGREKVNKLTQIATEELTDVC